MLIHCHVHNIYKAHNDSKVVNYGEVSYEFFMEEVAIYYTIYSNLILHFEITNSLFIHFTKLSNHFMSS